MHGEFYYARAECLPMPAPSAVRIVLVRTSHPGNIGAAARAMKTMGLERLALVAPRHFPHADAQALAAGAADVLERASVHPSLEDAIRDCVLAVGLTARERDLAQPGDAIRALVPRIVERAREGAVAMVFGNETSGLSNEELARCQWMATIPASARYRSLNLAAAVQVVAYELALAGGAPPIGEKARARATGEDLEALVAHFETCAIESGYLDPRRPGRLMLRLRRLFARAALEREEVKFLRGFLTAVEARMRRAPRDGGRGS
jgi:tRNA/rRNA methyltransferase